MKKLIEDKIKILNEWYDFYVIKLEDAEETDHLNIRYLNNRLLEIRAKISILEELLEESGVSDE